MKLFHKAKDGGEESTVHGYWLVEIKRLFSIALLRFDGQSREAFHTHAFHCVNWVISGSLTETMLDGTKRRYHASWRPFVIRRDDFHKVDSDPKRTWVLTLRGPWLSRWKEYLPDEQRFATLTHGRKIVPEGMVGG